MRVIACRRRSSSGVSSSKRRGAWRKMPADRLDLFRDTTAIYERDARVSSARSRRRLEDEIGLDVHVVTDGIRCWRAAARADTRDGPACTIGRADNVVRQSP